MLKTHIIETARERAYATFLIMLVSLVAHNCLSIRLKDADFGTGESRDTATLMIRLPNEEKGQCLAQCLDEMIATHGAKWAYEWTISSGSFKVRHLLGPVLLRNNVTLRQVRSLCETSATFAPYAPLHGAFWHTFMVSKPSPWTLAESVCYPTTDFWSQWNCLHALGHGVALQVTYNANPLRRYTSTEYPDFMMSHHTLGKGVVVCEQIPYPNVVDICAGGLYHSYAQGLRVWRLGNNVSIGQCKCCDTNVTHYNIVLCFFHVQFGQGFHVESPRWCYESSVKLSIRPSCILALSATSVQVTKSLSRAPDLNAIEVVRFCDFTSSSSAFTLCVLGLIQYTRYYSRFTAQGISEDLCAPFANRTSIIAPRTMMLQLADICRVDFWGKRYSWPAIPPFLGSPHIVLQYYNVTTTSPHRAYTLQEADINRFDTDVTVDHLLMNAADDNVDSDRN